LAWRVDYGRSGFSSHPRPAETAKGRQRIEALADRIDALAEGACDGLIEYRQFEAILGRLHADGFFPKTTLSRPLPMPCCSTDPGSTIANCF